MFLAKDVIYNNIYNTLLKYTFIIMTHLYILFKFNNSSISTDVNYYARPRIILI